MLTLAIQTAVGPAQAALLENDNLLGERTISERFAVCRELTPEIAVLLEEKEKSIGDLGLIAVCLGPGSFTGIRIGVATAKALAHALNIPLVGLNSLATTAYEVSSEKDLKIIVFNAGKEHYFCAVYRSALSPIKIPAMISENNLKAFIPEVSKFREAGEKLLICGEFPAESPKIFAKEKAEFIEIYPTAASIGRLAVRKYKAAGAVNALTLIPYYLRVSSPEERVGIAP